MVAIHPRTCLARKGRERPDQRPGDRGKMHPVQTSDAPHGRNRRWLVPAVTAAAVVLVAVGIVFIAGYSGSSADRVTKLQEPRDGVSAIPDFPARFGPAVANLQGQLFVFGGYGANPGPKQILNDAVLVSSDFATVRSLPNNPTDPPLYAPSAVGAGGQLVVVGVKCQAGEQSADAEDPSCAPGTFGVAVLDFRDGRSDWREVEPPQPLSSVTMGMSHGLGATSDGRAIFELGPLRNESFWSFDPATDAWHQLIDPGVRPEDACLSGNNLLVLSASFRSNGRVVADDPNRHLSNGEIGAGYAGDGFAQPTIASLDLKDAREWVRSTAAPEVVYAYGPPEMTCTNDGAAVVDPTFPLARFYSITTGDWTTPSMPPSTTYFRKPLWTGSELVFLPTEINAGKNGMSYNPATGVWSTPGGFPFVTREALWNGHAIVGYSEPLRIPFEAVGQVPQPGAVPPTSPPGVYQHVLKEGPAKCPDGRLGLGVPLLPSLWSRQPLWVG